MIVREGVPMAPRTTLGLGGPARRMVDLESEEDVVAAVTDAEARGERLFVLGGGSNVVVSDDGFPGLVACMAIRGVAVWPADGRVVVEVGAGEDWDALVERAVTEGWRGLECLSGIPGLVGATPIQNVGAYGSEVAQCLTRVRAFDRTRRAFEDIAPAACGFGYRTSVFKGNSRWIVTGVTFELGVSVESLPVEYAELARALGIAQRGVAPLARVRETVVALRRGKGMVVDPGDPDSVSAGSFFVNPIVDEAGVAAIAARAGGAAPPTFDAGAGRFKVAAAWLIERAGFSKGWGEGRAGISRKHALALVNRGGSTARELLAVARAIRRGVRERFGVSLQAEPVLVGEASWEEKGLDDE